jgi:hypothetical protein
MDKIILLMIVGLLIIGAIALNDILNSQNTNNSPTAPPERQTYNNPSSDDPLPNNTTEVITNPPIPPSQVSQC